MRARAFTAPTKIARVHDTVHEAVKDDGQVNVSVGTDIGVHPVAAIDWAGVREERKTGGEGGGAYTR